MPLLAAIPHPLLKSEVLKTLASVDVVSGTHKAAANFQELSAA